MDLIEKLGGYESAKGVFSRMGVCQRGCIEDKFVFFSFAGLQKALLEYRREHNIFEVGDKVVYKDTLHCKPVLMQIIEFGEVSKIPRCEIIGSVGAIGLKGPALVDLIRHATDAEIEMGKRVQQYETLPESVRQSLMEVT